MTALLLYISITVHVSVETSYHMDSVLVHEKLCWEHLLHVMLSFYWLSLDQSRK